MAVFTIDENRKSFDSSGVIFVSDSGGRIVHDGVPESFAPVPQPEPAIEAETPEPAPEPTPEITAAPTVEAATPIEPVATPAEPVAPAAELSDATN